MHMQHLPTGMTHKPNAIPPQYSNNDEVIERGSVVRVSIIGMRSDVDAIYGVGKMSAEWFG